MKRIAVDDLPTEPLAAAGVFHQHWLDHVETVLAKGEDVLITLPPADYTHREWRRAAVAMLARQYTPLRVNVVSGEGRGLDKAEAYLSGAPGITGQYLET